VLSLQRDAAVTRPPLDERGYPVHHESTWKQQAILLDYGPGSGENRASGPPVRNAPGSDPVPAQDRYLRLLGCFDLTGPRVSALGSAEQRLLALVAVHPGTLARWQAAQMLYPQATDARAASSLRAVLWRLQRSCPAIMDITPATIRLATDVVVDYWTALPVADRLLNQTSSLDAHELADALRANLHDDLLPGWPEPWLVPDRERFHQLRLHALEALCARLTRAGCYGAAVDVGLTVVNADPLRESARHVLMSAYLAEGNSCEAVRQFDTFCAVLQADLGLEPTVALRRLLPSATAVAVTPAEPLRSRS
jgi:DNA-binding SARP family transcriptional activator